MPSKCVGISVNNVECKFVHMICFTWAWPPCGIEFHWINRGDLYRVICLLQWRSLVRVPWRIDCGRITHRIGRRRPGGSVATRPDGSSGDTEDESRTKQSQLCSGRLHYPFNNWIFLSSENYLRNIILVIRILTIPGNSYRFKHWMKITDARKSTENWVRQL